MLKYPRTRHLEGSRLGPGDEDLEAVPLAALRGASLVVEEKVDGANAGVRFDDDGKLWLQSRGHFLTGGARERHFDLFKQWAHAHAAALHARLGARYALYGEWLYAKHTVFYDRLPHYFLEYDVLDVERDAFLSTTRRRELLAGVPIASVRVLHEGLVEPSDLPAMVGRSGYKSDRWWEALRAACEANTGDAERAVRESDPNEEMEGLYVKHEQDGQVMARYKFVRQSFLTAVLDSGTHWLSRPIVPNALCPGVDLFAPC